MSDLVDRVRAGLEGERVAVLLSGGRDSVCLLDCAARVAAEVHAVHVDYGLREGSPHDAAFCADLCASLGVPLNVERAGAVPSTGNVQAWARDLRYAAAERTGLPLTATGHTATDQAETILYRLAASPGRRALLGMAPREGRLIRPLLGMTREETAAHCTARGLAWREDPTNASDAYARNRARAGLVPALRALHPAAEANVNRTAELLRDEAAVLDQVVATALAGRDHIPLDHLALLPPALARLVVRRLAEDATGHLCSRAPARLPDVLALREGALDLGDGVRAIVEDGVLRMAPTPPLPTRVP